MPACRRRRRRRRRRLAADLHELDWVGSFLSLSLSLSSPKSSRILFESCPLFPHGPGLIPGAFQAAHFSRRFLWAESSGLSKTMSSVRPMPIAHVLKRIFCFLLEPLSLKFLINFPCVAAGNKFIWVRLLILCSFTLCIDRAVTETMGFQLGLFRPVCPGSD